MGVEMAEFKDRIKKLRLSRDLTQDELSRKLGISRSTIGMYETGKREADYETLELIADFFNVDINYLTGWTDHSSALPMHPVNTVQKAQDICDYHPGQIAVALRSDERKLLKTYNTLNETGKQEAQKRITELSLIHDYVPAQQDKQHLIPQAAHERTDIEITDEMRQFDDDLMDNDDFWK